MNFLQAMMPYCIQQLDGGFHIVLNRKYKPLGVTSPDHVDYDTHPSKVKIEGLTVAKAVAIGMMVVEKRGTFYLYEDMTEPDTPPLIARYNAILAKLSKLEVV